MARMGSKGLETGGNKKNLGGLRWMDVYGKNFEGGTVAYGESGGRGGKSKRSATSSKFHEKKGCIGSRSGGERSREQSLVWVR